jgi:hypothetical protein
VLISFFTSEKDNAPQTVDLSWEQLAAWLQQPRVSPCTIATCVGKNCSGKYGPGWSPAVYNGTRSTKNVTAVSLLSLDLDHLTQEQLQHADARLRPYRYIAHSTHNDRAGDRALRVILPLSRPVFRDEYPRFWRAAVAALDVTADRVVKDAGRLFFLPSHPSDAAYLFSMNEGAVLDVDAVLRSAQPEPDRERDAAAPDWDGDEPPRTYPPASKELIEHAVQRLEAHGPSIKGQGGDKHAFMVGAILLHELALTEQEAWPLAQWWNQRFPENTWSDEKLAQKLINGARYASGEYGAERDRLEARAGMSSILGEVLAAHGPPQPPQGEPGSWDYELARARYDVASLLATVADAGAPAPLFMSAVDVLTMPHPETPWLVQNLITRGGTAVVSGEPKTSKTWVLTEIALAVAAGEPVFGKYQTGTPRCVAYFFAEDLARQVRARLRSLAAGHGRKPEEMAANLFVQPRGRFLDVTKDEDMALIVASCRKLPRPVELLILEPLRDLHSGEEDKSDAMRDVMRRLRVLGELLQCTVAVAHHSNKSAGDPGKTKRGGQKMRGSSAIHGSIDSGIYLALDVDAGNGETVFKNAVESEVKGARSAGYFDLTLSVEDDEHHEAVKAIWTVELSGTKEERKDRERSELEERVLAYVRENQNGPVALNRTILKREVKGTDREKISAINYLIARGDLMEITRPSLSGGKEKHIVSRETGSPTPIPTGLTSAPAVVPAPAAAPFAGFISGTK